MFDVYVACCQSRFCEVRLFSAANGDQAFIMF
jgi:hypothetical protein